MTDTLLVDDCPRCSASKMTFDVHDTIPRRRVYDWQRRYEAFSVCRNCKLSTVFVIAQNAKADDRFVAQHDPPAAIHGSLNPYFEIEGFICVKDIGAIAPPEFAPEPVAGPISSYDAVVDFLQLFASISTMSLAGKQRLGLLRGQNERGHHEKKLLLFAGLAFAFASITAVVIYPSTPRRTARAAADRREISMEKMAAAIGFFCAILLVLMASVPEASAVVPGARGPRGPVKVDRPVGHCGWVRGVWVCR